MTLNDLLPKIYTLCDQMTKNGGARNTATDEYAAKIPFLADIGQRELIEAGHLFKTYNYTKSTITGNDLFLKVDLPSDFGSIVSIIDTEKNGNYLKQSVFNIEGKDLYISNQYLGTIRINYIPYPAVLTALTDALSIDDTTAIQALVYFICAMLLIEENSQKAGFYNQKYDEQKAVLQKRGASSFEEIQDVYGTQF